MLNGGRVTVLFDAHSAIAPDRKDNLARARMILCNRYPSITCLQFVSAEPPAYALEAYRCGVKAVIPRPSPDLKPDLFVDEFVALLQFLPSYLMTG
jgi:hypothetical protein